jgi:hypothetical protein
VHARLAPQGAQRTLRLPEHARASENVVLGRSPGRNRTAGSWNRPPTDATLALAAEMLGDQGADPVIDLDLNRRALDGEEGTA